MTNIYRLVALALLCAAPALAQESRNAVDSAVSRGDFDKAIGLCRDTLKSNPGDVFCALELPRIYSWTSRFDESVNAYDFCITHFPKEAACRVEKARVLGWAKKYEAALAAYEDAYATVGDNNIKDEMEAKRALWSARAGTAIDITAPSFKGVSNQELLMDIGQVYSNSGLHRAAQIYYSRLLAENPYNRSGKLAADRNDVQENDFLLMPFASAWRATSTDRDTDVDRVSYGASLVKDVVPGLNVSLRGQRAEYRYDSQPDLHENSAAVAAQYRPAVFSGIGARYALYGYQGATDSRNSYVLYGWHKFFDSLDLSASYEKENSVINRGNITNGLYSRFGLARAVYHWDRKLELGADYRAGSITDGNYFNIQGGDIQYSITEEPRRVYAIVRAESWVYRIGSSNYYAPQWYAVYSFIGGYRHNFNKDLYYGARQIYADVQLKYAVDSNREPLWQPRALFHADFGKASFGECSWNISSSQYYNDTAAQLSAGLYF